MIDEKKELIKEGDRTVCRGGESTVMDVKYIQNKRQWINTEKTHSSSLVVIS